VILLVAAAGLAANMKLDAPPRFDGAGYAVLARSLASGQGFREIDHPDRPRHAHFPPGYPLALAALWQVAGVSAASAHLFSAGCTLLAIALTWRWFERLHPPRTAWLLALALACNWRWQRDGGAIQSEPLFLLLTALALLAAEGTARRGGMARGVGLGLILGAAVLTRHVGIGLALACLLRLAWSGRWRAMVAALLTAALVVAPWVVWLVRVGRGTQPQLVPTQGLGWLILDQLHFYRRRLPDQIIGPVIEVFTVFRPELAPPATFAATLATLVIVWGWIRCLRSPRRRLAGLVPAATFPILLVWPFTEAGRFLVPLIPFVLIGAREGLTALGLRRRLGYPRRWAAIALVAASVPYSLYAALSDRAGAQRRLHADFDAACAWIATHGDHPGPVLTRHPGEVFWQTGRAALELDTEDPAVMDEQIERYGVAYLIVDAQRYAQAPTNPLERYVVERPGRTTLAWRGETAAVYELGCRR
jgi:hypothetical protein